MKDVGPVWDYMRQKRSVGLLGNITTDSNYCSFDLKTNLVEAASEIREIVYIEAPA